MLTRRALLAGLVAVASLAGCFAEPDESTGDGRQVECDDVNQVDVGDPDPTVRVDGRECERTEAEG